MVKEGESGTDCGWVQVNVVGFGHTLTGNPTAKIETKFDKNTINKM